MLKSKVLFMMSGSIACYKACAVISKLVQNNCDVQVVLTEGAEQFIGAATCEGLTSRSVFRNVYGPGQMMGHIDFAKWADLTLVCPATANVLNKFAAGLADDAVTTLFLAHDFKKPFLIAPAMNQGMWNHPATQSSLQKLKSWGVQVLPTDYGHQACGDVGEGRLLEPDLIFEAVIKGLAKPSRLPEREL
jgi:phosphopantothenoylcysteine decarboxylase / phosphopantothenate---cysteine ligase